ncbi:MAG: DUF1501 domain-containing protein [Planctomycetaceae bacterium]
MLRISSGGSGRNRRELLQLFGASGLLWPFVSTGLCSAESKRSGAPGFGRAKSVILVYTNGGQSQLETWDPKPEAPAEIRGEFGAIPTSVPGVFLSEHFPKLAQHADRYAIIRSMSHEDVDHGSATYLALTGRYHSRKSSNPDPGPNDAPTLGAILKNVRPTTEYPYTAVHVNGPAFVPLVAGPGQNAGLLGRDCDPMLLGDVYHQPVGPSGFVLQNELPTVRLSSRRSLLDSIDRFRRQRDRGDQFGDFQSLYEQAYQLLDSPRCRDAFDLTKEQDALRDRYGRNRAGQACLLARRLVEIGIPWVTVFFNHNARGQDLDPSESDLYGWDTHNDIFDAMKNHLMPRFDLTFSTLLDDLQQRGLLESTLVVGMGEFGRAPRIALEQGFAGKTPGRKHWASAYSIVMAGAGIKPGQVYGASDRLGAYPQSQPTGPWDVAATMFSALGVDPAGHYLDPFSRPFEISTGQPIAGLY